MDERNLDCCVVRDLLPSYLEDLTEAETAQEVEAHLKSCETCRISDCHLGKHLSVNFYTC